MSLKTSSQDNVIRLPVDSAASQSKATPPAGLRVLVVEDETMVALVLQTMLARLGHRVVGPVAKVDQAVEIAQEETLDLAILDVDLNGAEVYPVADVLGTRGIPYVFLTGYGVDGLHTRYRDRPALSKPFRSNSLQQVLATACSAIRPEEAQSS